MGSQGALALLCLVVPTSALTSLTPSVPIRADGVEQVPYRDMSFNGSNWFLSDWSSNDPSGRSTPARPGGRWILSTPECPAPEGAESWSQKAEDQHLYHNYFCGKRNGTYVEMGALDGVCFSNTKFFEDHMGWTGALIEASPPSVKMLHENRGQARNSIFGEAVCAKGTGHIDFLVGDTAATNSEVGAMPDSWVEHYSHHQPKTMAVPCRPLSEMLTETLARNGATQIDFFSLDVEGGELKVLETMDWNVRVGLWFIEVSGGRPWQLKDLQAIMEPNGYRLLPAEEWMTNNVVFVPV
jgi:FkbM family methyltransferase